jgi:LEA14-like dessication related protein
MPLLLALLSGCAALSGSDAPNVRVVGMEPLPSEGLEVRFALKLRVQNPNENALVYDGMSVNLDLDGRGLASGVSNASGEIPRFSDAVLTVPVSISAFSVVRQLLARTGDMQGEGSAVNQPIAYSLKGKLGAADGSSSAIRFSDRGELNIFASENEKQ